MNTTETPKAHVPEDIARLFVQRINAKDADGAAALYAEDAVMAFPPGKTTVGRAAIREVCQQIIDHAPPFEVEEPLPTIIHGDLALTATQPKDGAGGRAQVAQRQADGSWLRILDRPESAPTGA